MTAVILAARRLHKGVRTLLETGFAGGSGKLFRLEKAAWKVYDELPHDDQKAVCAGVAEFLDRIARRQDGEALTEVQTSSLASAISQPLLRCTDFLIGRSSGVSPSTLLGNLNLAYSEWRAMQQSR